MGFWLVMKSVTFDDLERQNGHYFVMLLLLFLWNAVALAAN